MRILIGCEESGKVRRAARARGHDAYSNDIIPARDGGPHIQKCIKRAIVEDGPWDIIILHPDCTKISLSGNKHYAVGKPRHHERLEAIEWTLDLWKLAKQYARIGCAMENPKSVLWAHVPENPFFIHPWQFGHGEVKPTGIVVHNLPKLIPMHVVAEREDRIWRMPPGEHRKRDRSETYDGIAEAFIVQWCTL